MVGMSNLVLSGQLKLRTDLTIKSGSLGTTHSGISITLSIGDWASLVNSGSITFSSSATATISGKNMASPTSTASASPTSTAIATTTSAITATTRSTPTASTILAATATAVSAATATTTSAAIASTTSEATATTTLVPTATTTWIIGGHPSSGKIAVTNGAAIAVGQLITGIGVPTGTTVTDVDSYVPYNANTIYQRGDFITYSGSTYYSLRPTQPIVSTTSVSGGAISDTTFVVTSATSIVTGQRITGTGIPVGTHVTDVTSTTITIDNAFTGAATGTYNFYDATAPDTRPLDWELLSTLDLTIITVSNPFTSHGTSTYKFYDDITGDTSFVVASAANIEAGQLILGAGLSVGTVVTNVSSTTITVDNAFTAIPYGTYSFHSSIGSTKLGVTISTGIETGQLVTGTGIPSSTYVTNVSSHIITVSNALTATADGTYNFYPATGSTKFGVTSATGISIGQLVSGTGVPATTYVTDVSSNIITVSNAFTAPAAGTYNFYADIGCKTFGVASASGITVGQLVTGTGLTEETVVSAVNSNVITVSNAFTAPAAGTYNFYAGEGSTTFGVTSATGIVTGQLVIGAGIPSGTFVTNVSSNTITIDTAFTDITNGTYNFYAGVVGSTTFNVNNANNIAIGQLVTGTGITSGTTVTNVTSNTITIDTAFTDIADGTYNFSAGTGSTTFGVASATNIATGQIVTGTGIPVGTVVTNVSSNVITVDNAFNAPATGTYNFYAGSGCTTFGVTSATGIEIGQKVTGTGVPSTTYVTNISSTVITISNAFNATADGTYNFYAGVVGSKKFEVSSATDIATGQLVSGTGIVEGTTVTDVTSTTITLSKAFSVLANGTYTFYDPNKLSTSGTVTGTFVVGQVMGSSNDNPIDGITLGTTITNISGSSPNFTLTLSSPVKKVFDSVSTIYAKDTIINTGSGTIGTDYIKLVNLAEFQYITDAFTQNGMTGIPKTGYIWNVTWNNGTGVAKVRMGWDPVTKSLYISPIDTSVSGWNTEVDSQTPPSTASNAGSFTFPAVFSPYTPKTILNQDVWL
jgi:hypothetical protein